MDYNAEERKINKIREHANERNINFTERQLSRSFRIYT